MGKIALFLSLTFLFMSCQVSPTPQLTATPEEVNTPALVPATPQQSLDESEARIAAISALNRSFTYIEPLTMIKIEKMRYGEYVHLIQQSLNQPADLEVWAVIFFDEQFQSSSRHNEGPFPPFRGCVGVAIKAGSGAPVEVGGPLTSNSAFPECDN